MNNTTLELSNEEKSLLKRKEHYQKNRDIIRIQRREYRKKNKEQRKKYSAEYFKAQDKETLRKKARERYSKRITYTTTYVEQNKDKIREYHKNRYLENKKTYLQQAKNYYLNNKDKRHQYIKKYLENTPSAKLAANLRTRVWIALKSAQTTKCKKTLLLLGCTIEELKKYIEGLWQSGMGWENHAKDGWHLDHIIPCASFDLTDPIQQEICFHYTNLQPLWCMDNLSKGSRHNDVRHRYQLNTFKPSPAIE